MAELERLANHLGDIGAICNDAAFALMHAHCGVLRERVLRAADAAFGHRLMMDRVVPGGVAADLADDGARGAPRARRRDPAGASRRWSSSTTTPPRCRTARSAPAFCRPSWPANSAPAAMSAAPRPRLRRAPAPRLSALRRASTSTCRCSRRATSTPGSGSASARSSRACR